MCGITGLIGNPVGSDAAFVVRAMTHALARRGPDGWGIESWPGAALGHRRLAIFDLSDAGRQPMLAGGRDAGLVFNGAIYNFQEIRADLVSRGYRFRSRTDTEVLLHGYREWGIDGLVERLRGMFAFAIWDDTRRKLFLVRDRLGVKPLVYAAGNGWLAFASSVRALRAAGLVDDLDPQAVADYLEFGYVTEERTIYRGARKLPPATILEWSGDQVSQRCYWSPPDARAPGTISFEDAVAESERLFLQAVRRRLEADVPIGALLSGGVDSSLVCWAIAQLGADITSFTVGTPGDAWDETADASATARELGIRHLVIGMSGSEAPDPAELVSAYGEPFACASALGMLKVCRAVKPHATVLLTGDGGDDVFLGYPEHLHFWRAQKLAAALPPLPWQVLRRLIPQAGPLRRGVHFLDYATGGMGAVHQTRDGFPFYSAAHLLGERLAGAAIAVRQTPWRRDSARRLLAEFLEHDRHTRFVGEYLTKVDGASMHYALEARSPFLDQDLWEFAASLPFAVRLRGGRMKAVLRELARRRIGPRVAEGRKRGFGIPVQRWIAGPWRADVEQVFRDSLLARDGWIEAEPALAELRRAMARGQAPKQLWYLFVLENWLRHSREQARRPDPAMAV